MKEVLSAPNAEQHIFPFKNLIVYPYQTFSGALNMALDFFIATNMQANDAPVLRFYGWQPYCLSLGYHQDVKFIDLQALKQKGYQAVRRPTGGSAILHSQELTYGLIVPNKDLNNHAVYQLFHHYLVQALKQLGVPVELHVQDDKENYLRNGEKRFACFNRPAFAEIKFNNKKVVGSAQKLYKNALLQHGSILLGPHQNTIIELMNTDAKAKERYLQILKNSSISLSEIAPQVSITPNAIIEQLLQQFEKKLNIAIRFKKFDVHQLQQAQKFVHKFKIQ